MIQTENCIASVSPTTNNQKSLPGIKTLMSFQEMNNNKRKESVSTRKIGF